MKYFAVIGDPIKHSLSPQLHEFVYDCLNIDASYTKIHVIQSELVYYVNQIRKGKLDGINVTIPHKTDILKYVDEVNPRAEAIGVANVVMLKNDKVIGNNTDWYGFVLALKKNKIDVCGKDVILLGAGGVSKAIIFALKQQGVSKIHLFNRTFKKISQLCDKIIHPHKIENLINCISKDSIIINCTSVGMNSDNLPLDSMLLDKHQTIIDTIYTPLKTKLVRDAENMGACTMTGLDMFIYQALASIDLWFGESISEKVDFRRLKKYLIMILQSR